MLIDLYEAIVTPSYTSLQRTLQAACRFDQDMVEREIPTWDGNIKLCGKFFQVHAHTCSTGFEAESFVRSMRTRVEDTKSQKTGFKC